MVVGRSTFASGLQNTGALQRDEDTLQPGPTATIPATSEIYSHPGGVHRQRGRVSRLTAPGTREARDHKLLATGVPILPGETINE